MKRAAMMAVLALAGCMAGEPASVASRTITLDGVDMSVRQVDRGTTYGLMADSDGNYAMRETGRGQFIAVAGAPDRDTAIRAFGVFCGREANPADWDTDQVPVAPDTGEYQFGGTCG